MSNKRFNPTPCGVGRFAVYAVGARVKRYYVRRSGGFPFMYLRVRTVLVFALLGAALLVLPGCGGGLLSPEVLGLPPAEPWVDVQSVEFLESRQVQLVGNPVGPTDSSQPVIVYGLWPGQVGVGVEADVDQSGDFSVVYDFGTQSQSRPSKNLLDIQRAGRHRYVEVDWERHEWRYIE